MPSLLYRDVRLPLTVLWVPRSEWGSTQTTETFIANRYSATAAEKTNVQIHHTAAIDVDDTTPNQWDYDEAAAYMRRLQWSRPDLGPLPYSENLAVSEDPTRVWLFQGRGLLKVGAHTAGYNRSGIGWGVLANFDQSTTPETLSAVRQTIRLRVLDLQSDFPNLGSLKNPRGWDVWGHRDTSAKSCPGNLLYPTLSQLSLKPEDDRIMLTQYLTEAGWRKLITAGVVKDPNNDVIKYWVTDRNLRTLQEHIDASSGILGDLALLAGQPAAAVDATARASIQKVKDGLKTAGT